MLTRISGHTVELEGLGPASRVLDLGAHRGQFSKLLKERLGGGRYCLIEANPALADDCKAVGNFLACAVGAESGTRTFHISNNPTGSSLLDLPEKAKWDNTLKCSMDVTVLSLPDILDRFGLPELELLKMDIEGAEVEVLDALPMERLAKIRQITVEFHSDTDFGFHLVQATENTIRRIRKAGFQFMDLSDGHRIDVLFLNRRYFKFSFAERWMWSLRNQRSNWFRNLRNLVPVSWRRILLGRGIVR
jgi:FkbM family methyltransferase